VKMYRRYDSDLPATCRDVKMFLRFTDPDTPGGWMDSTNIAATSENWGYAPSTVGAVPFLKVYGGETNLWGLDPTKLTPAVVNNGLQVVCQFESLANGGTAGVICLYSIHVEITYEV
jgi:hypothetical protein